MVRLVTIAKPDCWVFFLAYLGACPPNKHLSRILFRGTATQDSLMQLPRPWREIAEDLLREPNTERMPALLKELNHAFEDGQHLGQ